jgi:catechol 2,3-dioxygenase-like lactoylglutathione lyase family enzyme
MLHTMLRVADLNASKRFYGQAFGMKVLRDGNAFGHVALGTAS